MKLFYYDAYENFGDGLNAWLWPRIFAGVKFPDDLLLVGIGTILDARIPQHSRKIIFGSGFRPSAPPAKVDDSWDFSFVRGPRSAAKFGGVRWIADPAYCLRLLDLPDVPKRYKLSFIPHNLSQLGGLSLQNMVEKHGIHFIDPQQPVETILNEIRMSEAILCEAMHGAIVADAYRIPWRRVKYRAHLHEKPEVSDFKWADWAEALDVTPEATTIFPAWTEGSFPKRLVHRLRIADANRKFRNAHKLRYQLSGDAILNQRIAQLQEAVEALKRQLASDE